MAWRALVLVHVVARRDGDLPQRDSSSRWRADTEGRGGRRGTVWGRRVSLDLGKPWAPEKCQLRFFQLDSISRTLFDYFQKREPGEPERGRRRLRALRYCTPSAPHQGPAPGAESGGPSTPTFRHKARVGQGYPSPTSHLGREPPWPRTEPEAAKWPLLMDETTPARGAPNRQTKARHTLARSTETVKPFDRVSGRATYIRLSPCQSSLTLKTKLQREEEVPNGSSVARFCP